MRHSNLFIYVLLITFGIGYLSALHFYFQKSANKDLLNKNQTLPTQAIKKSVDKQEKVKVKNKPANPEYVCKNKTINDLESLLNTEDFINRVNSDNSLLKEDFPKGIINCNDIYIFKELDLNDDGKKEILISGYTFGLCNMRDNCEFWIFRKIGKRYEQILHHEWMFSYRVSNQSTNGFANIEINANSSNGNPSHYLHIHKFNGKTYQLKKCFSVYEFDGNKELKKPKKIAEPCDQ